MTIMSSFSKYQLTSDQEVLVDQLDEFLNSKSSNCYLLKGYAGTGKTFITKGLTEYLTKQGRNFVLAAPTGKAAKVISQKTGQEAFTIHKTIYSDKSIKEYKTDNINGTETYKFYYDLRVNDDESQTVYIIDEASMIADVFQDDEFFRSGSGFLLRDLLKYINLDNNDHNKKIIFIGDNAQLPPVRMNSSPALDQKYLAEEYGIQTITYELTEVVRQSQHSGILENSIELRDTLKTNIFNKLDFNLNYDDVAHVEHSALLKEYLRACDNSINDEAMIIAYSNTSVKEYNDRIRDVFFPGNKVVAVEDRLLVTANNSSHIILISNGDFGVVKEVEPFSEKRRVIIKKKNKETGIVDEIEVILSFKNTTIEFIDLDGTAHNIQCKIVEDLLYSEEAKLTSDQNKAIYIDFQIRNRRLKPGTKEFKDQLRKDPYFNSLKVKFGYAITCHKSQGSEWNQVFVNCKAHQNQMSEKYFRWLYTAITRASIKLYMLDEPHYKYGETMKRISQPGINKNTIDRTIQSTVQTEELKETFDTPTENQFLLTLLSQVKALVEPREIEILDIQHHDYHEIYHFKYKSHQDAVKISYNGKNKITHITTTSTSNFSDGLNRVLKPLESTLIVPRIDKECNEPEFDEDFLKVQYEFINNLIKDKNIEITNVIHHPYLEKYFFNRQGEQAVVKFNYNGKKQFKKWEPEASNSNSKTLVEEIVNLIEQQCL